MQDVYYSLLSLVSVSYYYTYQKCHITIARCMINLLGSKLLFGVAVLRGLTMYDTGT